MKKIAGSIIISLIIFAIIISSSIAFLYYFERVDLSFPLKAGIFTALVIVLVLSLIILILAVFYAITQKHKIDSDIYLKKCNVFETFYELLYDYSIDEIKDTEILKKLKMELTLLSLHISDKTLKLLNDYLHQPQAKEKDVYLNKKDIKKKLITFEECILSLRQELGIYNKNNKNIKEMKRGKEIFDLLELEWFEWSKNRVWHFETTRDYGALAFELMKKHNLIFTGGGPKGLYANKIRQIKKNDIIIAHKSGEGYMGIAIVTVDTKTIVWPKDSPLLYSDGEIRIPVRWLLVLNLGVDCGYIPTGIVTRLINPDRTIKILEPMLNRAKEAGNEVNENEILNIIKNIKSLTRIEKKRELSKK